MHGPTFVRQISLTRCCPPFRRRHRVLSRSNVGRFITCFVFITRHSSRVQAVALLQALLAYPTLDVDSQVHRQLGEALAAAGRHLTAATHFEKSIDLLRLLEDSEGLKKSCAQMGLSCADTLAALRTDLKASLATALYDSGTRDEDGNTYDDDFCGDESDDKDVIGAAQRRARAMQLVITILAQDDMHFKARRLYARTLVDGGAYARAVQALLPLLSVNGRDATVRSLLGRCVDEKAGLDALFNIIEQLPEGDAAATCAFLRTLLKDEGQLDAAIQLGDHLGLLQPYDPAHTLAEVHVLEAAEMYEHAVREVMLYWDNVLFDDLTADGREADGLGLHKCGVAAAGMERAYTLMARLPPPKAAAGSPCKTWLQAVEPWKPPASLEERRRQAAAAAAAKQGGGGSGASSTPPEVRSAAELPPPPGLAKVTYRTRQLEELAALLTAVKVLFINGALSTAAELCTLLQPLRQASAQPLHETLIRNENAYFGCVLQLLADHPPPAVPRSPKRLPPPLFVLGDSHCLPPAWRTVTLRGRTRLLHPLLVTGCKIWHLRPGDDSNFYTKVQFHHAVGFNVAAAAAADRSLGQVVLVLGEIDCREGVLQAVAKAKVRRPARRSIGQPTSASLWGGGSRRQRLLFAPASCCCSGFCTVRSLFRTRAGPRMAALRFASPAALLLAAPQPTAGAPMNERRRLLRPRPD